MATVAPPVGATQRSVFLALEALDHLLGGAEDTVALFVGQLQRGLQALVLQLVVMLFQDVRWVPG